MLLEEKYSELMKMYRVTDEDEKGNPISAYDSMTPEEKKRTDALLEKLKAEMETKRSEGLANRLTKLEEPSTTLAEKPSY